MLSLMNEVPSFISIKSTPDKSYAICKKIYYYGTYSLSGAIYFFKVIILSNSSFPGTEYLTFHSLGDLCTRDTETDPSV